MADGVEQEFRSRVEEALRHARKLLDVARQPEFVGAVPHRYEDKFAIVERATQAAILGQLNVLEFVGLAPHLRRLQQHASSRSVALRLTADICCKLDREAECVLDGTERKVDTISSVIDRAHAWSTRARISTTVVERFWRISVQWQLSARMYSDAAVEDVLLHTGHGWREEKTVFRSEGIQQAAPRPDLSAGPALEVDITWLLRHLTENEVGRQCARFNIDRLLTSCCTPRRNADVDAALKQFAELASWATRIREWLQMDLFRSQDFQQVPPTVIHRVVAPFDFTDANGVRNRIAMEREKLFWYEIDTAGSWRKWACGPLTYDRDSRCLHGTRSSSLVLRRKISAVVKESDQERLVWAVHGGGLNAGAVDAHSGVAFPLVLAMFSLEHGSDGWALLSLNDFDQMVAQHQMEMHASLSTLSELYAGTDGQLVGACFYVQLGFLEQLCETHVIAVEAMEMLLRTQLIAAVGKALGPENFIEYMDWHNQRMFRKDCRPRAFCYPIQRPKMSPDAHLRIDLEQDRELKTFVVQMSLARQRPMSIPLSASVNLTLGGERFLHGVVLHRFGQQSPHLTLSTRVRMFGCVVLLIGTLTAADTFTPKDALILRSGEAVAIPLLLETLPTAQEFRDATESMSPEQQRFATAFRAMQLASTVFAVVVIPIKPQLERLLNLPDGSLTQEVQLTQDILELLIDYQIPSSLMSYEGDHSTGRTAKVEAVRRHVGMLREMLSEAKMREKEEQERLACLEQERIARLEQERRLKEEERRRQELAALENVLEARRPAWSEISYSVGEAINKTGYDHLLKITMVGDENAGKSSLMLRFTDDAYSDTYKTTIGVDFKIHTVEINGKMIKLQIWDTAGQARFQTITRAYYRGSMGIMLVFDVTNKNSFFNLTRLVLDIDAHASDNALMLLVGNKTDDSNSREVDSALALAFAEKLGIPYLETSAKTAAGVNHAFLMLAAGVLSNTPSTSERRDYALTCAPANTKKSFMSAPSFNLNVGARLGSAIGSLLSSEGRAHQTNARAEVTSIPNAHAPQVQVQAVPSSPPVQEQPLQQQQSHASAHAPTEQQQQAQQSTETLHAARQIKEQCCQSHAENIVDAPCIGSARDMVELDCTQIPFVLDRGCDQVGDGRVLRPTVITAAEQWTRWSRCGLMGCLKQSVMSREEQRVHYNEAFELLDALCRSGTLDVVDSSMHVMFATMHCFDHSVLETLVQSNINPIDKVEQSSVIVASAICDEPLQRLLVPIFLQRLDLSSP